MGAQISSLKDSSRSNDAPFSFRIPVAQCEAAPQQDYVKRVAEENPEDNPIIQSLEKRHEEMKSLPNPGSFEVLSSPPFYYDVFEGFKIDIQKRIGPALQVTHGLNLGNPQTPGGAFYHFGVNGTMIKNGQTVSRTFASRLMMDGRLDFRWNENVSERVATRLQALLSPDNQPPQVGLDVDYTGADFVATAKWSNAGVLGVTYLQSITKRIAMGGEAYYVAGGKQDISTSYGVRYADPMLGTTQVLYSKGTFSLQYHRTLSPKWTLLSDLQYSVEGGSAASTGFVCNFGQGQLASKVDHNGRVTSVLETALSNYASLAFSAEIQHATNEYAFGYGIKFAS